MEPKKCRFTLFTISVTLNKFLTFPETQFFTHKMSCRKRGMWLLIDNKYILRALVVGAEYMLDKCQVMLIMEKKK